MATSKNVYQKLNEARLQFIKGGVKKSGKNMSLAFKYYELEDIVPTALEIFNKIGLISVVSIAEELATMKIVDTDNPTDFIEFTSPMRYPTENKGINPIQALGGSHTYMRRYLYLMALDVCEADEIDARGGAETTEIPTTAPVEPKTEPKEAKPISVKGVTKKANKSESRAEIKAEITNSEEPADEVQIKALKTACKKLLDLDAKANEEFVTALALKTNSFTDISKSKCEAILTKVREAISNYEVE